MTRSTNKTTASRKMETYKEIVEFSERLAEDRLRVLVKSLCPSIYGHEIVKCGMLLCLFGGVRKVDKSNKNSKNSNNKKPVEKTTTASTWRRALTTTKKTKKTAPRKSTSTTKAT